MAFVDGAKQNLEDAKHKAEEVVDHTQEEVAIAEQRVEGEIDKAKGDELEGEAKILASKVRKELNKE